MYDPSEDRTKSPPENAERSDSSEQRPGAEQRAVNEAYQSPPDPRRGDSQPNSLAQIFTMTACFQLVVGLAIQIAVFRLVDLYWAICASPMVFAAFASMNLNHLDAESERRVKRILTWVTLISIGVAMFFRRFLGK